MNFFRFFEQFSTQKILSLFGRFYSCFDVNFSLQTFVQNIASAKILCYAITVITYPSALTESLLTSVVPYKI